MNLYFIICLPFHRTESHVLSAALLLTGLPVAAPVWIDLLCVLAWWKIPLRFSFSTNALDPLRLDSWLYCLWFHFCRYRRRFDWHFGGHSSAAAPLVAAAPPATAAPAAATPCSPSCLRILA